MTTMALSRRCSVACMLTCCWCCCMLWSITVAKDISTNRRCTSEEMLHKREGKVCGSQIPILVNMTCRSYGLGIYNPKSSTSCRKSRGVRSTLEAQGEGQQEPGSGDDIFLSRMSALSMLRATTKRHYDSIGGAYHTGIVCECCVNKCSLRELQAYCSPKCPSPGGVGHVGMTSSASSLSPKMKRRGGEGVSKKSAAAAAAGFGGGLGVIDLGQGHHGHHRQHSRAAAAAAVPHHSSHHQHHPNPYSSVVAAGGEHNKAEDRAEVAGAEEGRLIRNAPSVSHTSHLSSAAAGGDVIDGLLLTT